MLTPTGTLDDIVPDARGKFRELLQIAEELGMKPAIRSAGRTCAEQLALYGQGSSTTQANLCRSWHVLGRAIDLNLHPNDCATYTELGEIWEDMGGQWGGRWKQFGDCGDAGHFQYAPGAAVPESVCPNDISVHECDRIREAYLVAEGNQPRAVFGVLAGAAIVLGVAWAWVRK